MFKKSLIALALTTASVGAFAAADITGTVETEFSLEGSASLAAVTAADLDVDLGAEYSVGDILTFTFSGGDVDTSTAPANYTTNGANAGSVTVGLLNTSADTLTYRVTEVVAGGTTIGETILLTGIEFDRDAVAAAGAVTVTYAAETDSGVSIDSGSTSSTDLFTVTSQFTLDRATDDDFDATIDVEEQRLQFDDNDVIDVVDITIESDTALTFAVDILDTTVDLTLNGNFNYLDDDADTAGVQLPGAASINLTGAATGNGAGTIAADGMSVSWTGLTIAAVTDTLTVTIDSEGAVAAYADEVIPVQSFTADITVDYDDFGDAEGGGGTQAAGSVDAASELAVGMWDLNGSVVEVPYMPMGPITQPFLRHTNDGSQTGDITLRYMVEGEHTSYQDGGTLVSQAAPGVTNLLSEINAALVADGFDASASGFKVALEITTNVPADDVKVTAGAKFTNQENTDRLSIGVIGSN
jgi:hypothetical protein